MSNFLIGLFLGILIGLAIPPVYKWAIALLTKKKAPVDNLKALLMLPIVSLGISSCGHFPDGTSVWGDYLWIIPFLLIGGSVWFFYTAYRKSKSGSEQQTPHGYEQFKENVKIYKIGQFWFGVILAVACIAVIIAVNASK